MRRRLPTSSPLRPLLAVGALLLALAAPPAAAATKSVAPSPTDGRLADIRPDPQLWGTVAEVRPGPQLVVVTPEQTRLEVRLIGVQMPQAPRPHASGGQDAGQPFGQEAAAYLEALLLNKQILLEPHGRDRAGRLLAVVYLGEINVNLTLVKEGLAWVSPGDTAPKVRAPLEVAERQAQVAKYGLWSLPNPEPPWEFRKRHRLPTE